jgi:hypothetical protein
LKCYTTLLGVSRIVCLEGGVGLTLALFLLGLKNAFENGVYHCDVSVGNININSHPTPRNTGTMIDFDHASTSPQRGPEDPITVCVFNRCIVVRLMKLIV